MAKPGKLKVEAPLIVICGQEGSGKTTLAAEGVLEFGGVFIRVEDGLQKYAALPEDEQPLAFDVLPAATLEKPEAFKEALSEQLDWCWDNMKPGQILAIDTISVMFQRLQQTVLHRYGVSNVAEAAGGYGKGYLEIEKECLEFIDALNDIRIEKDVAVILLCHQEATTIKNDPIVEAALVYNLAMDKKSAAVFRQQAHAILAINYDMVITGTETDKMGKVTKAGRIRKVSKRHLICDGSTPAYSQLCKNRLGLPPKLELPEGDLSLFDSIKFFEGK